MKFGVLVFPGSNCDHDIYNVIESVARQPKMTFESGVGHPLAVAEYFYQINPVSWE